MRQVVGNPKRNLSPLRSQLAPYRFLPKPSWAICTSATRIYATSALSSAGVPMPDVFVTSEDVVRGKPDPDPYLLGAQKCGIKPENCQWCFLHPFKHHRPITLFFPSGVVFEDAPSGIRSGRAAGCKTIALLTTHSRQQIEAAQPDFIVKDLSWSVLFLVWLNSYDFRLPVSLSNIRIRVLPSPSSQRRDHSRDVALPHVIELRVRKHLSAHPDSTRSIFVKGNKKHR